MISLLEILFYIIFLAVVNSFLIYPLIITLYARTKPSRNGESDGGPAISILIAAHNEEKVIAGRIENIALSDYDFSKIEVIVGSDASDDRTDEILREKMGKYDWLKIYVSENRCGKAGILNEIVKQVNHKILVFTDSNTVFKVDTLRNLVRDFRLDEVGGVCGKLILVDDETSRNEGVEETRYWKYETFIKRAEGRCGVLLSANGGIFAIRKELFRTIPTEKAVTDDLFISLSIVSIGRLFTYAEDAVAFENIGRDIKTEFNRKLRFSATNFQTLVFFRRLLINKNRLLGYAFLSHKVTRWILPWFLLVLLILSFMLSAVNILIFLFMTAQVVFYFFSFMGLLMSLIKVRVQIFSLPYFFVVSNIAAAAGFIKFLRNKHSVIWEVTRR